MSALSVEQLEHQLRDGRLSPADADAAEQELTRRLTAEFVSIARANRGSQAPTVGKPADGRGRTAAAATAGRAPQPNTQPNSQPNAQPTPGAGWYDDPYQAGMIRFWNGSQWTTKQRRKK